MATFQCGKKGASSGLEASLPGWALASSGEASMVMGGGVHGKVVTPAHTASMSQHLDENEKHH